MASRRDVLKHSALWASFPALSSFALAESVLAGDERDSETTNEFVLPPLPFNSDLLEPYLDGRTLRIHHGKHFAGYTNGLNKVLRQLQSARDGGDFSQISLLSRALAFHAGGYLNHLVYFANLTPPDRQGEMSPKLGEHIARDFGSFDKFKAQFTAAALGVEGNGWAVLAYHQMLKKLLVLQILNHENLLTMGMVPLLIIDVWEHAYYMKYQNKRNEYIDGWWHVVNWSDVNERHRLATQ